MIVPRQWVKRPTLASNHEAAQAGLLEDLLGGELEIEFEHGWLSS